MIQTVKEIGLVTWCGKHRVFVRLIGGLSYPSAREYCAICEQRVRSYARVHGER